ncbi:hypothetical protein GCM10011494_19200 [Novosphingobium endophyticum]|uniref:Phytanoyl-CoA dioxygenase n=2 Tax=Novosphingobium endophyticum TaxID=1955250 RepID=A0A916TS61_9SPHN|nr:hypothetical protein GCM10011494_19200 [Novosphingobium endophyticum]
MTMSAVPTIDPNAIEPRGMLRDSMPDIDDKAVIDARYREDGYLFLKGLLPVDAVAAARARMSAPLVARGLARIEGDQVYWTGGDAPSLADDDASFQGVCQTLFAWPGVLAAFERLLGERMSVIPMVQYRAYRPGGPLGRVHQDGFFSPGIQGYRPLWIPLAPIDAAVGGLAVAAGLTGKGYFHLTDMPPAFDIPADCVPDTAWLSADYVPGDVLVIHPETPHVGLPNRSDRVRLSLDTRIQSAANPSVLIGEIQAMDMETVTLRCEDGSPRTLRIDASSYLRTAYPLSRRMTPEEFVAETPAGLLVLASCQGDTALMVRRAQPG